MMALLSMVGDPRLLEIALCLLVIGVLRRISATETRSHSER